jgi:hypothetical protein
MPDRTLTDGEKTLLQSVFASSLDLTDQEITTNDSNIGGADNSITYSGTPHYSNGIWCDDFSIVGTDGAGPPDHRWVFVHEFGHVWQSKYGTPPVIGWLANVIGRDAIDYDKNYYYDLTKSTDFGDYNIEQQAAIIADYWAISNGQPLMRGNSGPYCQNANPQVAMYAPFIEKVRHPEPPQPASNIAPSGNDGDAGVPGGTS